MSVRARPEPASVQHEDAEGIYLTPQQVAEARAILREIRESYQREAATSPTTM